MRETRPLCRLARARRHACAGPAFSRSRHTRARLPRRIGANARSSICARKFAARRSAPCVFPGSSITSRLASASGCTKSISSTRTWPRSFLWPKVCAWCCGINSCRSRSLRSPRPGSGCGTGGSAPAIRRISWRYERRWPTRRATPRSRATSSANCSPNLALAREGRAGSSQPSERAQTKRLAKTQQVSWRTPPDRYSGPAATSRWTSIDAVQVFRQDPVAKAPPYTVFTTAHDLVVPSTDLADAAVLRKERALLDNRRAEFRRDLGRLVLRLQRRLLARQMRNWSFDLDDGLVDASRLDRVVVNPGFASIYKQEEETEFRDTVVSILIDNSGSMRGKPIELACVAADLISAALERCGVSCEILGFTTRGWSGGQSARDWAAAGRPLNPGRLNDTLHIVYKAADQPVRRSRLAVCGMLNASILKENIDGEALLWASRRLLARQESRKVLIVISDGAPADQATLEENEDKSILDRNLRDVILRDRNLRLHRARGAWRQARRLGLLPQPCPYRKSRADRQFLGADHRRFPDLNLLVVSVPHTRM